MSILASPKFMVQTVFPKSKFRTKKGMFWIDDGNGRMIGSLQSTIQLAWAYAFAELCEHFKVQAEFFHPEGSL